MEFCTIKARACSDGLLQELWRQLKAEHVAEIVFYDGYPASAEEFCTWAKSSWLDARLVAVKQGKKSEQHWAANGQYGLDDRSRCPLAETAEYEETSAGQSGTAAEPDSFVKFLPRVVALYWLNNPLGKAYLIHFCVLRSWFAFQRDIGLYVVRGLLDAKDADGEPVISALLGLTPRCYRHVFPFIESLGFRRIAVLPRASPFAMPRTTYRDTVLSMLVRADIPVQHVEFERKND